MNNLAATVHHTDMTRILLYIACQMTQVCHDNTPVSCSLASLINAQPTFVHLIGSRYKPRPCRRRVFNFSQHLQDKEKFKIKR